MKEGITHANLYSSLFTLWTKTLMNTDENSKVANHTSIANDVHACKS